ncbi:signal peptidase I [Lysinibacillus fusiformis]|nr:signal peptidase I [Lysinibacillus fusiformis]
MEDKLRNLQSMLDKTIYKDQKFTENQQRQILSRARNKALTDKKKRFIPSVVFGLFLVVFSFLLAQLFSKHDGAAISITDPYTSSTVEQVDATEKDFLLEWLSDSMDRGNHDYITSYHSNLVVGSVTDKLKRGDVIYYAISSEQYIARIVGLPGEKIEIQDGQVFIDEKKLDAFYGKATVRGLEEKQFFEAVKDTNSQNTINEEGYKEYFSTDMAEVLVPENSYFVLVDLWSRGTDSRTLGPIHIDEIDGVVLGYQE